TRRLAGGISGRFACCVCKLITIAVFHPSRCLSRARRFVLVCSASSEIAPRNVAAAPSMTNCREGLTLCSGKARSWWHAKANNMKVAARLIFVIRHDNQGGGLLARRNQCELCSPPRSRVLKFI